MVKKTVLGVNKAHFAFYMAQDFFERGVEATKELRSPVLKFKEETPWSICFPICTLAFSLELALKGFLKDEQIKLLKNKRLGHKFIDIYKLINTEVQTAIENHFETCNAHNYYFFNVVYKPSSNELKRPIETTTREKIINALERNNEPFVDFRYFYDLNPQKEYSFDFSTIIKLIHSCLAVKANELGIELK